jgi:hypothetical protein
MAKLWWISCAVRRSENRAGGGGRLRLAGQAFVRNFLNQFQVGAGVTAEKASQLAKSVFAGIAFCPTRQQPTATFTLSRRNSVTSSRNEARGLRFPLSFSAPVYRFRHALTSPLYRVNLQVRHRELLPRQFGAESLVGFRSIPSNLGIDWALFGTRTSDSHPSLSVRSRFLRGRRPLSDDRGSSGACPLPSRRSPFLIHVDSQALVRRLIGSWEAPLT